VVKKGKKMKKKILIIIIVIIAMLALVAKRKIQQKKVKPYGELPVPVHVAEASKRQVERTHDYLAEVEAWQNAKISSRLAARVLLLYHIEGDFVKEGEILLQLDDKDIKEEIKGVEKEINGVKVTVDGLKTNFQYWAKENKRYKELVSGGAISQASADDVYNKSVTAYSLYNAKTDELESLNHTRDGLMSKLSYTKLVSPYDGLVTRRNVYPGDLASPGEVLMIVQEQSKLKLVFDIPQEDLHFIKLGLPVYVRNCDCRLELKITHIYPSFDKSKMVRVEVAIPPTNNFRIGEFVPVSVVLIRHENVIAVPSESLIETPEGKTAVFIIKNGKLEIRTVEKIIKSNGYAEVKGVKAGEKVVTSTFLGWATLSSGLRVEEIK